MRTVYVALFVVAIGACSGCPPHPIPTTIDMASPRSQDMTEGTYGFQACPMAPNVTPQNVCDGWFTSSGLACANCPGELACFDSVDVIYCVNGTVGCQDDPNCFYVMDGASTAPGEASAKRKSPKYIKKVPSKLVPKKAKPS